MEEKAYILNSFEKMVVNATKCGDYLVMGTCFFDNKKSNSRLDKNLFLSALKVLQKRHEILRSYLKVSGLDMYFVPHDQDVSSKISLNWLDLTNEQASREKLMSETAEFNSILFPSEEKHLLWRAQVIEYKKDDKFSYILNFVFLAIADGMYSSSILVETVGILNRLMDGRPIEEENIQISENMNIMCDKRGLWKEHHSEMVKKMAQRDIAKFNLSPELRTGEDGFQVDMFYIDSDKSNQIMTFSKKNKIRLTSYFYTASFYALKKLYDENNIAFPSRITCELPVCLRFRYQPEMEFKECRLHTTMVMFSSEMDKFGKFSNFWQDGQYLHGLILENTSSETGTLFSLSHNDDLEEYNRVFYRSENLSKVRETLSSQVMSDLAVSNLGPYVDKHVKEEDGNFEISEMYCTDPVNSNPCISCGLIIHLIYWKGKIMIDLGANKFLMGSKFFKRYKQLLLDVIDETLV
ncbi:hypothetical protein BpHYR1_004749 [Brachionus plicatilis]|uniref:Condensation domain-containing protein n=1 Tax=Brachionus plicatilis TaxID=10195 RepID=A0A3M7PMQ2_BRAPC|nr:hypothetical protein BpHYR1_004749 [Brachionus plicatilis]